MANVGFKLGLQAALDALIAKGTTAAAAEGSFYLTSDTNRLYIGKADGSVAPVNEGVITVANIAALPSASTRQAGQFYYATAENVLCVHNGSSWVQINSVIKNTEVKQAVTAVTDGAKLTTSVKDSNNTILSGNTDFIGADGVTVAVDNGKIKISGDVYTIGGSATDNVATITLDAATGTDSNLKLTGGSNVTVTYDETNGITIASKNTTLANGSVTITPKNSGFTIAVKDDDNNSKAATLDPAIAYGASGTASAKFVNGTATLNTYTKSEVDNLFTDKFKDFNAMEYQGTVGTTGSVGTTLPTESVKSGYSYLLSSPLTVGDITYPAGTLVIASGTEGTDGFLTDINWTYVTGSTNDTTYTGVATNNGMSLKDSHNNVVMNLAVKPGVAMAINASNTTGSGTGQELLIYHDDVARSDATGTTVTQALDSTLAVPVITGVTSNAQGHVTKVTTTTYNLKDTNADMDAVTYTAAATNNIATITNKVSLRKSNNSLSEKTGSFGIQSNSLNVTATGSAITMDLVWGTF